MRRVPSLGVKRFSLLACLAAWASVSVLLATRSHGLHVSPDSVYYLAAADGVARGDGVVGVDGEAISLYPPGLPWLMALPARLGAPLELGRWLHALLFGLLVLAVALWLTRYVRFWVAAGVAALTAVAAPLLDVHTAFWSEPLFVALSLPLLALLVTIGQRGVVRRRVIVVAGLLAAAATLTRYSGVSLLPIAAAVLLLRNAPRGRKATDLLVFGLAFGLPVLAWLIRNVVATGTPTGERVGNQLGVLGILLDGLQTMGTWFIPKDGPRAVQLLLAAAVAGVTVAVAVTLWRHRPKASDPRVVVLVVAGGYVVTGLIALVVMTSQTNVDPLGDRLLAPFAVPLFVAAAAALDLALDHMSAPVGIALGCAAAVALGANFAAELPSRLQQSGEDRAGFNLPQWQAAEQLLEVIPPDADVISNQPWAVNYLAKRPAHESPRAEHYASTVAADDLPGLRRMLDDGRLYLVWLPREGGDEEYHYTPDALAPEFCIEQVDAAASGAVYTVSPRRAGSCA